MSTKNLGQVAGLWIGNSAPENTSLIWYDNTGKRVAEFIPCYRISDNVCGFYDLVNNTFREGVGNFAYGEL